MNREKGSDPFSGDERRKVGTIYEHTMRWFNGV